MLIASIIYKSIPYYEFCEESVFSSFFVFSANLLAMTTWRIKTPNSMISIITAIALSLICFSALPSSYVFKQVVAFDIRPCKRSVQPETVRVVLAAKAVYFKTPFLLSLMTKICLTGSFKRCQTAEDRGWSFIIQNCAVLKRAI